MLLTSERRGQGKHSKINSRGDSWMQVCNASYVHDAIGESIAVEAVGLKVGRLEQGSASRCESKLQIG